MCFPIDTRTVARVHRFEVILEDPRRPGTSLSAPSRRDCVQRSQLTARNFAARRPNEKAGEDATGVHSYVSDDKRRAFCVQEALSRGNPRAVGPPGLTADRITRVQVLNRYLYM
jgi:hypothetical protein